MFFVGWMKGHMIDNYVTNQDELFNSSWFRNYICCNPTTLVGIDTQLEGKGDCTNDLPVLLCFDFGML